MKTLLKKAYYFARRPVCRELGLLRFAVTGVAIAAAAVWSVPRLEAASQVMRLSSTHLVVAARLHTAHLQARKAGATMRFCKSDDALTCSEVGGWEQGWIAFEDRNGNGIRDREERVLHSSGALPAEFVLAGDLNAGGVKLCARGAVQPACRGDQLTLALLSDGSRPRPS